jgi:hypothetical protein
MNLLNLPTYVSTASNPEQPVRVATNQLPTPTGRTPPAPTPVPLGNELVRRAQQLATGAQQILTGVQRLGQMPAETRAGVDVLFAGLGAEVQTVRDDVGHAAQLEKALPLLIVAIGFVVGRPLVGALVAGGFFLWQHRADLPEPGNVPPS